jgi:uncharacterized membrane protein
MAAVFIAAGLWLLTLRSRTAAMMLLILMALSLALFGAIAIHRIAEIGFVSFIGVCVIVNALAAIGAWRSVRAAFVYQRGGSVAGANEIAAQFE